MRSRALLAAMLACVSLLCVTVATPVAAVDPAFPSIPDAYSSVISINYATLNFTLAWIESWDNITDPSNPRLLTRGRYASSDSMELINFNTQVSMVYPVGAGSLHCEATQIGNLGARVLGPSKRFFDDLVQHRHGITYMGRSDPAQSRYIECDHWQGTRSFTRGNYSTSFVFNYFAAVPAIAGLEWAPVRFSAEGVTTNLTDPANPVTMPFSNLYDWSDFSFQIPLASVFQEPSACLPLPSTLPERTFSFGGLPTDTLPPAPLPLDTDPFPALMSNFKVTLEAKLDPVLPGGSSSSAYPTVYSYRWSLDAATKSERLDYQVLTDQTNTYGQGVLVGSGAATRLEIANSSVVSGATVYNVFADGSATSACTAAPRTLSNTSPLQNRRAGSLESLFTPGAATAQFREERFIERTTLRGVQVDHWMAHVSKFNGDALYLFDMHIYLIVPGWRFPGRNIPAGVSLPMRIINNGTWINSSFSTPTPYQDVYDLFFLLPDAATPDVFDPAQFSCPSPSTASVVFPAVTAQTSYTMHVSAAFLNRGYTMTFDEFFDARRQILRTDNRGGFGAVGERAQEIREFGVTNRYSVWNPRSNQCYLAPFVPNMRSRPTSAFFTDNAALFDPSDYVGQGGDAESRYIPSNRWQTLSEFRRGNHTDSIVATWYSSVPAPGFPAVPIRIRIAGAGWQVDPATNRSITDSARVFMHVYDFIDFDLTTPDESYFEVPPSLNCTEVDVLPVNFAFETPTLTPVLAPVTTPPFPKAPSVAQQFTALVELKTKAEGASMSTVHQIEWHLDRTNKRERIHRLPTTEAQEFTRVFFYESYPNKGQAWTLAADGTCSLTTFSESYTDGAVSGSVTWWSRFSGALADALLNDPDAAAGTPGALTYQPVTDLGIQADRGVRCDLFTGARQPPAGSTGGPTYVNYTSRYLTAGEGWVYFGSNLTHRPVRVMVSGVQAYSGVDGAPADASVPSSLTPRSYSAVLDVFHFDTASEADHVDYDVQSLCSNYEALLNPPQEPQEPELNQGEVAGAIVALLILVGIIGALAWWAFGRNNGRRSAAGAAAGAAGTRSDEDEILDSSEQPSSDRGRVAMSEVQGNVRAHRLHDMSDDAGGAEDEEEEEEHGMGHGSVRVHGVDEVELSER